MIEVLNHKADRLGGCAIEATAIPVYPHEPQREHGEAEYPHLAVTLATWNIDKARQGSRRPTFIPSEEQRTIVVSEQFATKLRTLAVGSNVEPFIIEEGVSDRFGFRLGGSWDWEPEQTITLTPGDAEEQRTAAQVIHNLMLGSVGLEAVDHDGTVSLTTSEPGIDLEILDVPNSANSVLGFTPGVYRHTEQAGPVSYTVKAPPTPIKMFVHVDVRATELQHAVYLQRWVLDRFPRGYSAKFGEHWAHWRAVDPVNHDEMGDPKYWWTYRWWIENVWIERLSSYEVPSIGEISLSLDADERRLRG